MLRLTQALDHVIPESLPWRHTDEGPDDSASHSKASIIGPSITIPITDGRLNLGTWQGIVRAMADTVPLRVPPRQALAQDRRDSASVDGRMHPLLGEWAG